MIMLEFQYWKIAPLSSNGNIKHFKYEEEDLQDRRILVFLLELDQSEDGWSSSLWSELNV